MFCRKRRSRLVNPVTVRLDKLANIGWTCALGNDNLDTTAREYLYGQPSSSTTLSHRKARHIVGLVDF